MNTNTYAVYSVTRSGSFTQKYEGTDEVKALEAYNKLVDANKPRNLTKREAGLSQTVMSGGGFPKD